ncbi:hypothetical protein Tco_1470652, partial [Tanacetum coccineum]
AFLLAGEKLVSEVTDYLHHLMKVLSREAELSSHGLFMKSDDDDDEDRDEVAYGEATVEIFKNHKGRVERLES